MNCVVVPIYKTFACLRSAELLSLNQLYKELGKYQIYLIGPAGFSWDAYINNAKSKSISLKIKEFQAGNFDGLNGYNKLMISENLYRDFLNYKYVLLYQLDAYVFRDELNSWCDKGYDYIGAQWDGTHHFENKPLIGVGNGGFSLRNTRSSLKLLKRLRQLEVLEQHAEMNWKGLLPRIPLILLKLHKAKKVQSNFEQQYNFQEDVFWCKAVPSKFKKFKASSKLLLLLKLIFVGHNFKIAPAEEALKFSFETSPRQLFEANDKKLPFGCHAWEKYEPEFWKPFIIPSLSNESEII